MSFVARKVAWADLLSEELAVRLSDPHLVALAGLGLLLLTGLTAQAAPNPKSLDILVVDMGLRPGGEEAARLRTLIQVMAPGLRVEKVHYRHVRERYLERKSPRALVIAPPRAAWSSFPTERLDKLRVAIRAFPGPVIGVDGGHQLLAEAWGGTVGPMANEDGEFGSVELEIMRADPILDGLPPRFEVVVGHKDEVTALPPGFVLLARGEASPNQLIRHEGRRVYGVQFRPEDPRGARLPAKLILRNFLRLAGFASRVVR